MKDEVGGKIMTEFAALRPETYSYLIDDGKKDKGTKKCLIKRRLKFNNYEDYLLSNEIILKSQQRFECEAHNVYTEEINKTALSSNEIKYYKLLIELHRILMVLVLEKYVKQSC